MTVNLRDRAKRAKLKPRPKPYWSRLVKGVILGYRRNKKGGVWLVRRFKDGVQRERPLDIADDAGDGTGMSYTEAVRAALAGRDVEQTSLPEAASPSTGGYTVAHVLNDYLAHYEARSGRDKSLKQRIDRKGGMRDKLGRVPLEKLTKSRIRQWRDGMVKETDDPEVRRKAQYNANKHLTILKAALNEALEHGHAASDIEWRTVKPFKNVDAPKIRYLETKEVKRLVNACESDFRLLVQCALLTGCRYGEIIAMRMRDVDLEAGTVHLPYTKSGKARHVYLTDEGRDFFEDQVLSKGSEDLLFVRSDGEPWDKNHQVRRIKEACAAAKIDPPITFHVLRHSYGAALARKGVALQVIANALGHADTRMTERHYAHLSPSYLRDEIQKHLPKLGIKRDRRVASL